MAFPRPNRTHAFSIFQYIQFQGTHKKLSTRRSTLFPLAQLIL
nr:MAG TPA: hypothetical protein [Caudoviricetes sp.]